MSAATNGMALLASPVRRRLVDTLADRAMVVGESGPEGMTAAALAEVVGLHVTTVRFHLDRLVGGGLVETLDERQGVGRPRKLYRIAAGALADVDDATSYRLLSEVLVSSLGTAPGSPGPTPVEAGREWARRHVPHDQEDGPAQSAGQWLGKVGRVIDVLRRWGYTPALTTTDRGRTAAITLEDCPFLELARSNPAVVCGIHRGLLTGALEQVGEPSTRVSLEPFVGSSTCLAHVTTTTPFRST